MLNSWYNLSLRRIGRRLRRKVILRRLRLRVTYIYMQNGGGDEEEDDVAMLSQAAKFTYCDPEPYVYPRGSSPDKSVLFLYSKHIA
jgi:hypothetical protein